MRPHPIIRKNCRNSGGESELRTPPRGRAYVLRWNKNDQEIVRRGIDIMHVRKLGATVGTVLFIAAAGLTQAATPVAAAPAGDTVIASATDFRDFKKGYRDGYRDGYRFGWEMARDECKKSQKMMFKFDDDEERESDYMRGYNKGYTKGEDKGFDKAFWEYCD
jgi:hypothetical protein